MDDNGYFNGYFDERVAAQYDKSAAVMFVPEVEVGDLVGVYRVDRRAPRDVRRDAQPPLTRHVLRVPRGTGPGSTVSV